MNCLIFLISEIKKSDEDEEIISHVLLRLKDMRKPSFLDIEYLKYLLVNGTFENRYSALKLCQIVNTKI